MKEQEGSRELLKTIIAEQRKRIDDLEQAILMQDQQLIVKDRLLEAYRNREAVRENIVYRQKQNNL